MPEIVLIDTSVYLNILGIPGKCSDRNMILDEFKKRVTDGDSFLLPLVSIIETGNHISRISEGNQRRVFATSLVTDVERAFDGETPYSPTYLPDRDIFVQWIATFPDAAMRSKSEKKSNEGTSLVDLCIIKEWERLRKMYTMSNVVIWSLDVDLAAHC